MSAKPIRGLVNHLFIWYWGGRALLTREELKARRAKRKWRLPATLLSSWDADQIVSGAGTLSGVLWWTTVNGSARH